MDSVSGASGRVPTLPGMVDVNERDELVIVREATIEGQNFRVRASLLDGDRVEIDFASADSGGLAGEVSVADLLPATAALSALFGGVAVAVQRARAARLVDAGEVRRRFPQAYRSWSGDEEERLLARYRNGATVEELSLEFGRQPGGIRARLAKLGLEQLAGDPPAEAESVPGQLRQDTGGVE